MKYALVDLGSNTVRLTLYDVKENGGFEILFSEKEMAGLVNFVSDGRMTSEGMDRACEAILKFNELLSHFEVDKVSVFATASLRNVKNTEEALLCIRERTGIDVEVISGEEEAILGYEGALLRIKVESGIMFDLGGGSTEVVSFERGEVESAVSCSIGSLSLFKNNVDHIMPTKEEIEKMEREAEKAFQNTEERTTKILCGVGGTARALLKITNDYFKKDRGNSVITLEEFEEVKKVVFKRGKKARKLILKSCPDRVHTIIPGMVIVAELIKLFGAETLVVSKFGVREGYLCRKEIQGTT